MRVIIVRIRTHGFLVGDKGGLLKRGLRKIGGTIFWGVPIVRIIWHFGVPYFGKQPFYKKLALADSRLRIPEKASAGPPSHNNIIRKTNILTGRAVDKRS